MRRALLAASAGLFALALSACAAPATATDATPTDTRASQAGQDSSLWPRVRSPIADDPALAARIEAIVSRMSLEQKVGQITMAEIKSISPDDARKYHIGGILNGGGSWPTGEADSSLASWLALANRFYDATARADAEHLGIPVIWGTDAVHGHNNVSGATVFPHNIGLGAANDPALMRDIGTATAREVAVTGIDWAFSPTVAVAKDARWGRTYESFSSDPDIVAELAKEYVVGLQGHPALGNFLSDAKIVATAKHFVGDGGTVRGDDQGDAVMSERELYEQHALGYLTTLGAGAQTVMASFNSWNGEKVHGDRYLLTDVLKERMGFDGFVVGDWNGHGQVEGCSNSSCAQSVNAGVDMIMVPTDWRDFIRNTTAQVRSGEITEERLDDAVRRILRVKARAGLLEGSERPSSRDLAARASLVGHADHRAVARRAVRQSVVVLENDGVLPLEADADIALFGVGADHPAYQNGGWTITWQGRDLNSKVINPPEFYKGHTTLREAMETALGAAGGSLSYSERPDPVASADAAVFVFAEEPYAEFEGDLDTLAFEPDADMLRAMADMRARGVSVVSLLMFGRPLPVDEIVANSDAVAAVWLPGSEGDGLADVLVGTVEGEARHPATGRLSFDWPGESGTAYPLGHGLDVER